MWWRFRPGFAFRGVGWDRSLRDTPGCVEAKNKAKIAPFLTRFEAAEHNARHSRDSRESPDSRKIKSAPHSRGADSRISLSARSRDSCAVSLPPAAHHT